MQQQRAPCSNYIVTGPCQSQKSWACFDVISMLSSHYNRVNLIFVTQANNARIVQQTMSRLKAEPKINSTFENYIYVSGSKDLDLAQLDVVGKNTCFVGFWHTNTRNKLLNIMQATGAIKPSIIVVDEAEQGGLVGTSERLHFVSQVRLLGTVGTHVILVTATIANLSKSAEKLLESCQDNSVASLLREQWTVRHVEVSPDYVNMQWYKARGLVRIVNPIPKGADEEAKRVGAIVDTIRSQTQDDQRRLGLICASTRTSDHDILGQSLLHNGLFNAVVELNSGDASSKSYLVRYTDDATGGASVWHLPYERICAALRTGKYAHVTDWQTGQRVPTLWRKGCIPTLPFILQAALFIGTNAQAAIKSEIENDVDWASLMAIHSLDCMDRPPNYPSNPHVGVIAGHMASRGITLTSRQAFFVYTMYLFVDSPDAGQCGAVNTQRTGRCFGNLMSACEKVKPIVLATERCVVDALANEHVAITVQDKEFVRLTDFVESDDWDAARAKAISEVGIKGQRRIVVRKPESARPLHDVRPIRGSKPKDLEAHVVTTFERLTASDFIARFVKNPAVAAAMKTSGISKQLIMQALLDNPNFNMSFTRGSAQKVANIRNYYEHAEWSGKKYHLIWENAQLVIIKRNKAILDSPNLPPYIAAHNEHGELVVYKKNGSDK